MFRDASSAYILGAIDDGASCLNRSYLNPLLEGEALLAGLRRSESFPTSRATPAKHRGSH
jgi:hypothetical protein